MIDVKLQMARQMRQSGQIAQARAIFKQIIAADPDNVSALIALGEIDNQPLQFDELRRLLEKGVHANPESAQSHIQLGQFLRDHNEFEQASAELWKAAKLDPDNAELYDDIAIITRYDEITDEVRWMQDMYDRTSGNSYLRKKLGFALGKIFDDLEQYDTAFEYFEEANRIGAAHSKWSSAGQADRFRRFRDIFDKNFLDRYKDIGNPDESPIFIAGMLRTGTTLTEQILCSHPDVYGGGETLSLYKLIQGIGTGLGQTFPEGFGNLEPDVLRNVAARYIEELKRRASSEIHVTDKMNGNFFYAALIAVMLPKAKIIFCKRDPRDQGLSYFQKDLVRNQPYCYNLVHIGEVSRLMQGLMDYWEELLPDKIYINEYENLVSNSEERIRDLLDYCGLEFDAACLSFYNTKRKVLGVSRAQIRQPMHTNSVGRWKNYEKQLQPLIDALGMN